MRFVELIALIPGLILSTILGFLLLLAPPGIIAVLLIKFFSRILKSNYLSSVYDKPSKHPFFCLISFIPVITIWYKTAGQLIINSKILETIALFLPVLLST